MGDSRGDSVTVARRVAAWLRNTPFHPQWLMPEGGVVEEMRKCRGRVLDIGSAGAWVRAQLVPEAHYIALDYPATAIGLYGTRPDIYADACRMPIADESVHGVACYEVVEHVRRPDELLGEVARVLVPGGVVEFTMPFIYPIHDAPHDYQRWTRHGWVRSLEQAGLVVEVIEPRGHSLHAAAITTCLALAGPIQNARPLVMLAAIPFLLCALPFVNLVAWIAAGIWPSWDAQTTGYRILARKPRA